MTSETVQVSSTVSNNSRPFAPFALAVTVDRRITLKDVACLKDDAQCELPYADYLDFQQITSPVTIVAAYDSRPRELQSALVVAKRGD